MRATINHPLLTAARAGDQQAIEQLLIEYQPTVTKFALKYCASPEDVEDAVQETLWIASRKVGVWRVSSAFLSWLFRVVRNECLRLVRLYRSGSEPLPDTALDRAGREPEQYLLLKQDVISALSQLPTHYREVLLLRDVEELTAPEVAAMLGISMDAVKARLKQALTLLRDHLQHWSS
jgi:RNA polymerase sigma factor (sigma-70 family)